MRDAAAKIEILKENNSPLLAVLLLTAQNTTGFPKGAASTLQQAVPVVKKADRIAEFFGGAGTKIALHRRHLALWPRAA